MLAVQLGAVGEMRVANRRTHHREGLAYDPPPGALDVAVGVEGVPGTPEVIEDGAARLRRSRSIRRLPARAARTALPAARSAAWPGVPQPDSRRAQSTPDPSGREATAASPPFASRAAASGSDGSSSGRGEQRATTPSERAWDGIPLRRPRVAVVEFHPELLPGDVRGTRLARGARRSRRTTNVLSAATAYLAPLAAMATLSTARVFAPQSGRRGLEAPLNPACGSGSRGHAPRAPLPSSEIQ